MKYFIISVMLSLFPLNESDSFAQVTCEGSPAEDNRAGRKKVKKWDNCQGIQFYRNRENKTNIKLKLKYDGFFIEGKKTGHGSEEILAPSQFAGQKYVGEFKNGQYHGQGTLELVTGEKHVGEFEHNNRTGMGKFTWPYGGYLEGYFENGSLINGLVDIKVDGSVYFGEMKNGNFLEKSNNKIEVVSDNGSKEIIIENNILRQTNWGLWLSKSDRDTVKDNVIYPLLELQSYLKKFYDVSKRNKSDLTKQQRADLLSKLQQADGNLFCTPKTAYANYISRSNLINVSKNMFAIPSNLEFEEYRRLRPNKCDEILAVPSESIKIKDLECIYSDNLSCVFQWVYTDDTGDEKLLRLNLKIARGYEEELDREGIKPFDLIRITGDIPFISGFGNWRVFNITNIEKIATEPVWQANGIKFTQTASYMDINNIIINFGNDNLPDYCEIIKEQSSYLMVQPQDTVNNANWSEILLRRIRGAKKPVRGNSEKGFIFKSTETEEERLRKCYDKVFSWREDQQYYNFQTKQLYLRNGIGENLPGVFRR